MDFFPASNQQKTEDNFSKTFESRDLAEVRIDFFRPLLLVYFQFCDNAQFSVTYQFIWSSKVVTFRKAQAGQSAKKELQAMVREAVEEEKSNKEISSEIKDAMSKSSSIQEHDAVVMVNSRGQLSLTSWFTNVLSRSGTASCRS